MKRIHVWLGLGLTIMGSSDIVRTQAQDSQRIEYRVLATTRTSTMEKELNAAADVGFRFQYVMGGETTNGGKEVVAILARQPAGAGHYQYKLLATNRTSMMRRELQDASDAGYEYRGHTFFDSLIGGNEMVSILERDRGNQAPARWEYRLLATMKTSTMEKELNAAGAEGFAAIGMTVGKTAIGGSELVTILRRSAGR